MTSKMSILLTLLLYTFIIDGVVSFGLNDGGGDGMNKIHLSYREEDNDDANSRRRIFLSSMLTTSSILVGSSSPAYAAKGAAEYDLEYYMRDLFMGNNKEGNLPVSTAPPPQLAPCCPNGMMQVSSVLSRSSHLRQSFAHVSQLTH